MSGLDPRAAGRGALIAVAVALPAAVIQNVVTGSSLRSLLFLVIIGAFAVGGWVAGRSRPDRALTNGAAAAMAGYLAVLAISTMVRLGRGAGPALAAVPLSMLIALSCGLLGGYVAFRRAGTGAEVDQAEVGP
jgi:putative membrane protein (TIGR04086 family)